MLTPTTFCQGVEYFLIKWKDWASVFNTWEPRSNLGCNDLIEEFVQAGVKRSWQSDAATANDPEAKRRRVAEVVDQLLILDPQLTVLGLIDIYEQLDASKVGQFCLVVGSLISVQLLLSYACWLYYVNQSIATLSAVCRPVVFNRVQQNETVLDSA